MKKKDLKKCEVSIKFIDTECNIENYDFILSKVHGKFILHNKSINDETYWDLKDKVIDGQCETEDSINDLIDSIFNDERKLLQND